MFTSKSSATAVSRRPLWRSLLIAKLLGVALALPLVWTDHNGRGLTDAVAAEPDRSTVEQAFSTFIQATRGDESAVAPAAEALTRLSQAQPTDPVLMAYAGSATAMQATTTLLPWKKMKYADDGLAMIDKALALLGPAHNAVDFRQVPAVLDTKLAAATTFLRLPGMYNRHDRGNKLLADVLNSPLLASSPVEFKANVWWQAAKEAKDSKNTAQARQWLQQVAASGTPLAAKAQAELKTLEQ